MDLSIIIVSYNSNSLTELCLDSIIKETMDVDYEIIVVDNASSDGSVEMIRNKFPYVKLICNPKNLGFAAAQNAGLREACGVFLLILNNDVIFIENTAKIMIDYLKNNPKVLGALGPRILNVNKTIAASARRSLVSRPMIMLSVINRHFNIKRFIFSEKVMRKYFGFVLGWLHDNYAPHDKEKEVEFVDGMCVLVKRGVLQKTGLFDEQFFFDYEIIDLANRIRNNGWKIKYFTGTEVIHNTSATRKKYSRILIETHRSELIYFSKYAPHYIPFIKHVVLVVVGLKRFIIKWRSLFCSKNNIKEDLEICNGIIDICHECDPLSVWRKENIPCL